MYHCALMWGKPAWIPLTRHFGLTFPRIPTQFSFIQPSQLPIIIFCGKDNRTRGKEQHLTARSDPPPPNLPLILLQGKIHAAPFRIATRFWRIIYLALREIFSLCIHVVVLSLILTWTALVIPPPQGSVAPNGQTWR